MLVDGLSKRSILKEFNSMLYEAGISSHHKQRGNEMVISYEEGGLRYEVMFVADLYYSHSVWWDV